MRYLPAVTVLGAACVWWSASPLRTGAPGEVLVVVAAVCVAAGLLRLLGASRDEAAQRDAVGISRSVATFDHSLRVVPWEAIAAVTIVVLEATHHRSPWHSGVLALALVAYLLVVRQAESAVPGPLFRGHVGTAVAGVALVVLVAAVASIPSAGTGTLAGWLEMAAALGAVLAVGLVLPRVSERPGER